MSIKKQFHDSLSIKQAENSVHLRQAICVSSIGISLVFYIVCFECLVFRDLLKGGVGGGDVSPATLLGLLGLVTQGWEGNNCTDPFLLTLFGASSM